MSATRIACLTLAAIAGAGTAAPAETEVDLKAAFLRCEAGAAVRVLPLDEAAGCSLVYERLLKTTFGGDFARLMAWWRSARAAAPQREASTRR